MHLSAEMERDFVKNHLGPTLAREHKSVALMIHDDQRNALPDFAKTVLDDPEAAKYVAGMGVHWYAAVNDHFNYFGKLSEAHDAHPDKFILGTEACNGYIPVLDRGVKLGDWGRGELYGHDILNDVLNWAVGWTDWNIVLDDSGGPN